MRIPKRDIVFFFAAVSFVFVAFFYYFREFCYDRGVAGFVYNTLDVIRGKGWYYTSWHPKPPGINFIILAAFKLFGESFKSIYLAAFLFNLVSVLLVYLLAKVILSRETRFYFLVPLFFSFLLVSEPFETYGANTEVFLVPFEITAILFLGLNRFSLCGLALGAGFLIHQSALFVLFAAFVFIIFSCLSLRQKLIKNLFSLVIAFSIPTCFIAFYFFFQGVLDMFLDNTFIYNLKHLGEYGGGGVRRYDLGRTVMVFWQYFRYSIIIPVVFLAAGLFEVLLRRKSRNNLLVGCWFLSVMSGLAMHGMHAHHLIPFIPPLAVVIVLGIARIFEGIQCIFQKKAVPRNILLAGMLFVLVIPYVHMACFYLDKNRPPWWFGRDNGRFLAAQYIKEHTRPQDKIFVWDHLSTGAILLWSARENIGVFREKYAFLPKELREYWVPYVKDYRLNQKRILAELFLEQPEYIVVVSEYGKVIHWRGLIKERPFGQKVGREEWEAAELKAFSDEEKAFPEFFALLGRGYRIEKEIGKCRVWKRRTL